MAICHLVHVLAKAARASTSPLGNEHRQSVKHLDMPAIANNSAPMQLNVSSCQGAFCVLRKATPCIADLLAPTSRQRKNQSPGRLASHCPSSAPAVKAAHTASTAVCSATVGAFGGAPSSKGCAAAARALGPKRMPCASKTWTAAT